MHLHFLHLNTGKTEALVFSPDNFSREATNIRSSKNLGIIFDLQLKFEIHLQGNPDLILSFKKTLQKSVAVIS